MRNKLGSIFLGIVMAVFVVATIAASYFGATAHTDERICKNQAYLLSVVDDLAQTARVLVQNDKSLDPAVKQTFVRHYNLRHRQIVTRIQHQTSCDIPTTQDSQKQ